MLGTVVGLIVVLSAACATAATPHPWPDFIGRLEDLDRRYGVRTLETREFERVLEAHGRCPELIPAIGETRDYLGEARKESETDLRYAESVAMNTQDTGTLEYLTARAGIRESSLSEIEATLSEMYNYSRQYDCAPVSFDPAYE